MSALRSRPRVRIPSRARAGEVIEIRMVIDHPMSTGIRHGDAPPPPRDMLSSLVVTMNGAPLFEAELRNGTSPNPYHVIHVRIDRTSDFTFVWTDEQGRSARAEARVTVG
ncbi:sulfur oxidation protein [Elioraea sp. Yellowstone]|jgi:sulfur-oxidizing protein SoxZ|uniref:thiosulfate oxidation carrier complex protein SoxZ n=1 Tax=Elioraea sp. Yellowstone TaxID=2592070 RepID=UPI0011544F89|nr:thiosulfate oxidation carrier complex protein SoxZ [Elioraea sp. Yellowstone]TQF82047.1 sulfur oxidation protein [Elioraea sp. Yellowstone]